jgi:ribulose bisphosphate carboxylase small subunit
MGTSLLPSDFKDFLRLLNSKQVEYLLIGGYAVGYYGFPRATADIDIWVAINQTNAGKVAEVIQEFFSCAILKIWR